MAVPAPETPRRAPDPGAPEALRAALAGFVRALHRSYLDVGDQLAPADRARLPLVAAGRVTVAAVATTHLHVVAATQDQAAPVGPELEVDDALPGLAWSLRFVDPVVLPALGLVDESAGPRPDEVRRLLGLDSHVYHLVVPPGGRLTGHHATHAGTGLAHAHAAGIRSHGTPGAGLEPPRDGFAGGTTEEGP